jgi:DNA polymerase V
MTQKVDISGIFLVMPDERMELPLYISRVPAGFPSPADDYIDKKLDLNEYLIKHPSATFYVKVDGDSMIQAGISTGDILIVDKAIEPIHNKIVVAVVDGEFTVKRFKRLGGKIFLAPENPDYPEIQITESNHFEVWGVVTNVIHKV